MDILRTILIIVGILLIAGIYLAEPLKQRWQQYRQQNSKPIDDRYADLDSDEALGLDKRTSHDALPEEWVGEAYFVRRDEALPSDELDELKGMGRAQDADTADVHLNTGEDEQPTPPNKPAEPSQPEQVIVMTVMAPQGKLLRGTLLLKALQDAGLRHGEMKIFHYTPDGQRQSLFSVANILEPGHFDMSEMVQMETPGIALFMQLPATIAGDQAWTQLRNRAEQLAEALHATLCDAQRRPLDEEGLLLLQHQAERFKAV
ncbi:MAG: hypothetical protein IBX49_08470 [Gammaproteobacteria bacterium]|nr:hypothetical protein [Gammaproteobacteria bacterium]